MTKQERFKAFVMQRLRLQFEDYCKAQGLPSDGDAVEMLMSEDLTADQRAWLVRYCEIWERAA
jgi:hypothetical protein